MTAIKRTINISFAGKRGEDETQSRKIKSIAPHLTALLAAFDEAFANTRFNFISGLADDADQVASKVFSAGEWLHENSDNKPSMTVVTAFGKDDYLKTIEHKKTFDKLYKLCGQKLHLDGMYQEGEAGKENRKLAHRQQSKIIVRMADVVIAAAPRGTQVNSGGTLETVQLALYSGKPVIFYNLDDDMFYYPTAEEWILNTAKPKDIPCILKLFREYFYPQAESKDELKLEKPDSKPGIMFRMRNIVWTFFYNFFEKRLLTAKEWKERKAKIKAEKRASKIPRIISNKKGNLQETIKGKRDELSGIISDFQVQYRGGYLLNYTLSVIAVTIAVFAIWCYIYISKESAWHPVSLMILGSVKICLIWLIIKNTIAINTKKYNKTTIDYRYVSERLRADLQLSFAGLFKSIKPSLGNHNKNYFALYPGERLYEKIWAELSDTDYEITLSSANVLEQAKKIERAWLDGQLAYHHKENKRHELIHTKLENWAELIGKLVLRVVIIELGLTLASFSDNATIKCLIEPLEVIAPLLLGIATLLPAVVTTLVSISFQAEAKRLSFRSEVISKEIKNIKDSLCKTIEVCSEPDRLARGSVFSAVLDELDKMGKITSDEVAEWSVLYEKSVPGTA